MIILKSFYFSMHFSITGCCFIVLYLISSFAYGQKIEHYKSNLTGDTIKYVVYLPQGYIQGKKYPLLLFLHGMSEKTWPVGSINPAVRKVGLPKHLENGLKLPFVVVVPNIAYPDWDNIGYTKDFKSKYQPGALPVEIAEMALKKYSVDTARVYITGISMGGGGTFSAVHLFPKVFAAAIPIAGWGDNSKSCVTITPVWAFQGSKDNGSGIRGIIQGIKECQPESQSKVTVLEGKGHYIWDDVYLNKASGGIDIYHWLLQHSKGK